MIAAVDIETSCGVKSCPTYGTSKCEHAVHHMLNKIDIIGVYDGKDYRIFRSVSAFDNYRRDRKLQVIGHGFKFDYKSLKAKGSDISPREVVGDTQLLASLVNVKVSQVFLKNYNEQRRLLNAPLKDKQRHRTGTPLSLKVLAPYYLNVPPFWENPVTHDDEEYNKKDCIYTYRLHEYLLAMSERDGTYAFYRDKLLPWTKLLCEAEYEGILIDETRLWKDYGDALCEANKLEKEVHKLAEKAFKAYRDREVIRIKGEASEKCDHYISKRLKDGSKRDGVKARYASSAERRISELPTSFNLQSPAQVKTLLEYYAIDMAVEKRDKETNEWIEKEGTDKYVLKRAKIRQKSEIAKALLAYREKQTEATYLKGYIESVAYGRIFCSFNATGTRTGRLSSSGPNLQNVKGSLRQSFSVADRARYSIYSVDSSQIEPRLVAHQTQDEEMIKLFQEGRDYHNYATKKFFPEETEGCTEKDVKERHSHLRKTAKIGDLSIIYGTGAHTFQTMCLVREEMDIEIKRCKAMVHTFREGMRGVFGWKKDLEERYKSGQLIYSPLGRLVQARDAGSVHMTLFNSLIQGLASDTILDASLNAYRHFCRHNVDAKPLIWVHDEVVWRFPKGKEKFCKEVVDYYMKDSKLETAFGVVPLDVEGKIADRWEK